MIPVVIAGVIGFVVVAIVLARQTSDRKKKAIASLEEEKKAIGTTTILDLVDEEITELGLRSIDGAEGIPADVLLRRWKASESVWSRCDRSNLSFRVAEGIERRSATFDEVTVICADSESTPDDG